MGEIVVIHVVYATKVNIGGWATFTRHLIDTLKSQGHDVQLWKIGNRTEDFLRPFGDQGHFYRNGHPEDIDSFAGNEPVIIAALGKHYVDWAENAMRQGAAMVIHDTAESSNRMKLHKPWVIRKALLGQAEGSVFIRHPYVRHAVGKDLARAESPKRSGAAATSRVDFDKNTRMILDANRLGAKIDIVGFENRLYTKFKIVPDYPEWVQSPGTHPRTGAASFDLLLKAKFMVDLTDIKGDGGGTQYTFLEAWDAGAVPIIGQWWLRQKDDMVHAHNCYAIGSAEELKRYARMTGHYYTERIREQGFKDLKRHAPKVIAPKIMEWLDAR